MCIRDRSKLAANLNSDSETKRIFDTFYEVYEEFLFSANFCEDRERNWIGSSRAISSSGIVLTMHHVVVVDKFHGTCSLHQHIAIQDEFEFGGSDGSLRDLVNTLHTIYWGPFDNDMQPVWLRELDPFIDILPDRPEMIAASRQIFTSVMLPPEENSRLDNWEPDAT